MKCGKCDRRKAGIKDSQIPEHAKGCSTPLPSVEEVVSHLPMFPDAEILMEDQLIDYDKYKVGEIATLITQDRNQAYTSLVEGIEGMKKYPVIGSSDQQIADSLWRNDTLIDILENVVKPLYGKTGDN